MKSAPFGSGPLWKDSPQDLWCGLSSGLQGETGRAEVCRPLLTENKGRSPACSAWEASVRGSSAGARGLYGVPLCLIAATATANGD